MVRRTLRTIFSPWGKVLMASVTAAITLIVALPQGTRAEVPTVRLNVLGYGTSAWAITDIAPGESGVKGITLENAGAGPGKVTIWLSNLQSQDMNGTGPGSLADCLTLEISGEGLTTTMPMPAKLSDFPMTSDSDSRIEIGDLKGGARVDLVWTWSLPSLTGNEAQGDSLSFDINYAIEGQTKPQPTQTPVPKPPAPPSPVRSIQVIVPGAKGVELIDEKAHAVNDAITVVSKTKPISISISAKATVINPAASELQAHSEIPIDEVPHSIEAIVYSKEPLPIPKGWKLVSDVWDISGYTYSIAHHVVIDPPARIKIGYYANMLPEYVDDIELFYWNETTEEWVQLEQPPGYVATEGEMAAMVGHLSTFAVLAKEGTKESQKPASPTTPGQPTTPGGPSGPSTPTGPTEPTGPVAPAKIIIRDLVVDPPQIYVGDKSTISAIVQNVGGLSGEYTATLTLEGKPIASQSLTLRPGESETVTWEVNPDLPGVYGVDVNELNDKLNVITLPKALNPTQPVYWWLVAVAGALVIMLIMLVRVGGAPAKVAVGVGAAGGAAYVLVADALKEIYIEPDKPTIGVRTSIQLRAVGRYYDGSRVDVTQKVEWRSSDPRTAEAIDEKEFRGLVFGHRPGVATIGIKWGDKEGSTTIGVNCSVYDPEHPYGPGLAPAPPPVAKEVGLITVMPRSEVIDIGGTTRFTATAHYADGTSENITGRAVWTSTNDFVADIDETGTARGYSAGMTAIIATFRGKRGTATLHVEG